MSKSKKPAAKPPVIQNQSAINTYFASIQILLVQLEIKLQKLVRAVQAQTMISPDIAVANEEVQEAVKAISLATQAGDTKVDDVPVAGA